MVTLGASALNAGHLAFKQPNPTLATPGAYAETLDQLTHGQQVMELERLCSSLSFHRLAQPDELQLLQQELARMRRLNDLPLACKLQHLRATPVSTRHERHPVCSDLRRRRVARDLLLASEPNGAGCRLAEHAGCVAYGADGRQML